LEGQGGRAAQVVLAAQTMLLETLRQPALTALLQRVAVGASLEPLGLHEAADYLVQHLRAAGGRPERIISDEALEVLARGTRGLPRLLNRAMHQALTLAFAADAALVDAEVALEALGALGQAIGEEESPSEPPRANAVKETAEAHATVEGTTSVEPVISLEDRIGGSRSVASSRLPA
jgi:hypothetical protein